MLEGKLLPLLRAAATFEEPARVINIATIKPIDHTLIEQAARECGAILTAEEHQATGGLGGAVAEFLASTCPVPIEIVGVQDVFGESGGSDELLEKYGLQASALAERARNLLRRREFRYGKD